MRRLATLSLCFAACMCLGALPACTVDSGPGIGPDAGPALRPALAPSCSGSDWQPSSATSRCGFCRGLRTCDPQGVCVPKVIDPLHGPHSAQPVFFMAWRGQSLYTHTGMNEGRYIEVANQLAGATHGHVWFLRVINQTKGSPLHNYLHPGSPMAQARRAAARQRAKAFLNDLRNGCTQCTRHTLFLGRLSFHQFGRADAMKREMKYYIENLGLDGAFLDFALNYYHHHPDGFRRVMEWATSRYPRAVWVMNFAGLGTSPAKDHVPLPPRYARHMYADISPVYSDNAARALAFPNHALWYVNHHGYRGHALVHLDADETGSTSPNYHFANATNLEQRDVLRRFYVAQSEHDIKFELPVFGGPAHMGCDSSPDHGRWALYNSQSCGRAAQSTFQNILNLLATGEPGGRYGPAACRP